MGLARAFSVVLLLACVVPAAAQTPEPGATAPPADVPAVLGTRLPPPDVDADAPPAAFLDAARRALAAGRGGEAMEALERAESRALSRSVRPSLAGKPSRQSLVQVIAQARAALAGGDRLRALQRIDQALAVQAAAEPE